MASKPKTRKLTTKQTMLLRKLYQLFASTGEWPRYRDLERALGFSMARVVGPLRPGLVRFTTPIGSDTICCLTLRGLASLHEAQDDLTRTLAAIGFIGGRAKKGSLSERFTGDALGRALEWTKADACRIAEVLASMDFHHVTGGATRSSDGTVIEFHLTEHSHEFENVDSVDAYEAVNQAIVQKRKEEAELNVSMWPTQRSRKLASLRPSFPGGTTEHRYHPKVEGVSRELLDSRHFSEAVRAALQQFEFEVRRRSGLSDMGGKDLMAKAFNHQKPILKIKNADQPRSTEQEGYQFIAMGAMLALRNKYSHGRRSRVSQQEAEEQLGIASYLFRRLEHATKSE